MKHTYFWLSTLLATSLLNPAFSMETPTPKTGKATGKVPSSSYYDPFMNTGDEPINLEDYLNPEDSSADRMDNAEVWSHSYPLDKTLPKGLLFEETPADKAHNERVWEENHPLDRTLPKGLHFDDNPLNRAVPKEESPDDSPLNKTVENDMPLKNPDELDSDFLNYMKSSYPELMAYLDITPIDDPQIFFQHKFQLNSQDLHFLPGTHGTPNGSNFWVQKLAPEFRTLNNYGQGWKIHITAMPQSAQKIAELVLPAINGLPHQESEWTSFKIIPTLPLMRTLWAAKYIQRKETQPGKFIVLYPDSPAHAYELVKKIDGIFNKALKEGILQPSDFLPMTGDARVGTSGGVYVRYGLYSDGDKVLKITPDGKSMPDPNDGTFFRGFDFDDRFLPWPDFMNKQDPYWGGQESPFHELPITWTSFSNPNYKITSWDKRPQSWNDIAAPK